MTKYAVVKIQGKQYKVREGDELLVDKLEKDQKPVFEVLLVVKDDKIQVGKPQVKGVKVKAKILSAEEKGKKLSILKFKAKSRYRRKYGFRPVYTRLLIENIG
jgi:large subunit ribosomal protein L21